MGIEWGATIELDGGRPAWLHDEQRFMFQKLGGPWSGEIRRWNVAELPAGAWGNTISAIRLPADHFAYLAIAKGYEPWGGGENAPADWDGEHVLFRNGAEESSDKGGYSWTHPHAPGWGPGGDIIGYRKRGWTKGAPFEQAATPPAPAQMTAAEARMLWARCATGDLSVKAPLGFYAPDVAVRMLDHLGFIRPDRTPLEQFLTEHPEADPATADLAIKWARSE